MLGFLKSMTRRGNVSDLMIRPHVFDCSAKSIKRPLLESQIKQHIESYQGNPISVFWSPLASGKTTLFKKIISDYNSTFLSNKEDSYEETLSQYIADPMTFPVASIPIKSSPTLRRKKPLGTLPNGSAIKIICDTMQGYQDNQDPQKFIRTICSDETIAKINSEKDCKYVFVIDDFDRLCSDSIYINTILSGLSGHARRHGFKIILLSSDPLITMDILRINQGDICPITNMTKDIMNRSVCVKWSDESMEQYVDFQMKNGPNQFTGSLTENDYYAIKHLSLLSSNPGFVRTLVSICHNRLCDDKILLNLHDGTLKAMAEHYGNQWNIGLDLIAG